MLADLGDALVLDVGAIHHTPGALLFLRDQMRDVHAPLDQIHDQSVNFAQVFAQLNQIRHFTLRLWRRLKGWPAQPHSLYSWIRPGARLARTKT